MINITKATKCITTIGPSSSTIEQMIALAKNGATCFRLNFSHGSHEEHLGRIKNIQVVQQQLQIPISIMLDTKGPEIRTHNFENDAITLQKGMTVKIYTKTEILGTTTAFSVNYPELAADVSIGTTILVDDGKLGLLVEKIEDDVIIVKVLNNHTIKNRRAINIPGIALSLPFISKSDREDIIFGCAQNVDYIAASFVNSREDILAIRAILKAENKEHIKIIAKIESQVAVDNFDEILTVSDAIMVARGDLGVEIPYYEVPYYEQLWLQKCLEVNKPVIVATQMLESMIVNPHPTRAEVTDVAVAVQWGASATMLSGESANGAYPEIAINAMQKIIIATEKTNCLVNNWAALPKPAFQTIQQLIKTGFNIGIVIQTANDETEAVIRAIKLANCRFPAPIFLVTSDNLTYTGHGIEFGIYPVLVSGENKQDIKHLIMQSYDITNMMLYLCDKNYHLTTI